MKIPLNIPGLCAGSNARENNFLSCSCFSHYLAIFALSVRGDATTERNSRSWILRQNCGCCIVAAFSFLSLTISSAQEKIDFSCFSLNPLYCFTVLVLVVSLMLCRLPAASADVSSPVSFQFYIIVSLKYLFYVASI